MKEGMIYYMNIVTLIGRLTKDPQLRYAQADRELAIARYTLAVDRFFKKEGEPGADFIPCVSFGRSAEFAEKYFRKGTKIAISGRIQTSNYINREGKKVYITEVIVNEQEFAGSKVSPSSSQPLHIPKELETDRDGFVNVPEGIDDELPFA